MAFAFLAMSGGLHVLVDQAAHDSFRRIRWAPRSSAAMRGAWSSLPGMRWAMPWCHATGWGPLEKGVQRCSASGTRLGPSAGAVLRRLGPITQGVGHKQRNVTEAGRPRIRADSAMPEWQWRRYPRESIPSSLRRPRCPSHRRERPKRNEPDLPPRTRS